MNKNIILSCDAYKLTHHLQYSKDISKLYSYAEPRVGGKYDKICFFGLRSIINDHLLQEVTDELIEEARQECILTFGTDKYFNREMWEKVRDLKYLPIKIMAIPEGTIIEQGSVAFTIESTEDWFATSIGVLETVLLNVWYPTTVCSRSLSMKNAIRPYFELSSDITNFVLPHVILDFGARGATGYEAAARAGAAHLVHFEGSDNMAANKLIRDLYGYKGRLKSVYATEHSTMTSFGPGRGEIDCLLHQLKKVPENCIISIVIDSYDADNFIQNVVGNSEVVKLIKKRLGRTVFREDSGKILRNLLKHSDMLSSIFGLEMNNKGYKIIGSNTGLLQADGNTEDSSPDLYNNYTKAGWAADNFIIGSGGGLLQENLTRDTQRWALKASYGEKDGVGFNIQKNPKTDPSKKSKTGRLKLHPSMRTFTTISSADMPKAQFNGYIDALEPVLENGKFYPETFDNILKRANS
jgi:nicotinamide phosphoribosyltransferase